MNLTINHIGSDLNAQDETLIHWFTGQGTDYGTGLEIDGTYGWADTNGAVSILAGADEPATLTDGDGETEAVRRAIREQAEGLTGQTTARA